MGQHILTQSNLPIPRTELLELQEPREPQELDELQERREPEELREPSVRLKRTMRTS